MITMKINKVYLGGFYASYEELKLPQYQHEYNVPGKKDRISRNFYSYVLESENKTGGTGSE
jgi:hypothetical protein